MHKVDILIGGQAVILALLYAQVIQDTPSGLSISQALAVPFAMAGVLGIYAMAYREMQEVRP